MANQQPYYHEIQILFTTTSFVDTAKAHDRLKQAIEDSFADEFVGGSIEIIESEPDPGDPSDLM